MTAVQRERVSYDEFLEIEQEADRKHELEAGRVLPFTDVTPTNALIGANIVGCLYTCRTQGSYRTFTCCLKVFIRERDATYYPDVSVVQGALVTALHDRNAVVNPVLVGEVMSPESRDRDLGTKATTYRQLPSVQEILLVDSEERLVVHQQRQDDGSWRLTEHRGAASIALSLGVNLELDELYDRTGL